MLVQIITSLDHFLVRSRAIGSLNISIDGGAWFDFLPRLERRQSCFSSFYVHLLFARGQLDCFLVLFHTFFDVTWDGRATVFDLAFEITTVLDELDEGFVDVFKTGVLVQNFGFCDTCVGRTAEQLIGGK